MSGGDFERQIREAKAEALREAADEIRRSLAARTIADWLDERADRTEATP